MKAIIADNRFEDSEIEKKILADFDFKVCDCKTSEDLAKEGEDADVILVNLVKVDAKTIEKFKKCKVISRYGIGVDNIDLEAAKKKGIVVANVPGYCDHEVAEHVLSFIFSIARGLIQRDTEVRSGAWNLPIENKRIAGTVLGIMGFGNTAKALLRISLSMGFKEVQIWSPHISNERIINFLGELPSKLNIIVKPADFGEVLSNSDWLSLHLPLKEETRGLIGKNELALLKKDAVIINTARGAIIDEYELFQALNKKQIAGAALDVFETEPLNQDSPLRKLPNTILTDHCAYASKESIFELRKRTAENALNVINKGVF